MGRKISAARKAIKVEQVEQLFAIQCTAEEVCSVVGVSMGTLKAWVKESTEYDTLQDMKNAHSQQGKASLRRTLFKTAQKDPGTLRFLAKNHLGMADKIEQNNSGTLTISMDSNVADNVT